MEFQDRSLQCSDCGAEFTFTVKEQEFYASKGYTNEPKRCPACRQARRAQRTDASGMEGGERPNRQTYTAVCSQCGKDAQLPFEPRTGRPVYCSDCYSRIRASR